MKPRPIEPGPTAKVGNVTTDISQKIKSTKTPIQHADSDMLGENVICLLVEVWGIVCLFLLMCSALSALVIFVETKPSSQASSWKKTRHKLTVDVQLYGESLLQTNPAAQMGL